LIPNYLLDARRPADEEEALEAMEARKSRSA
jgi:hypothetical protein